MATYGEPAHTAVRVARVRLELANRAEEVVRNPNAGALRFELDERRNPRAVALVRAGQEIWRAKRPLEHPPHAAG